MKNVFLVALIAVWITSCQQDEKISETIEPNVKSAPVLADEGYVKFFENELFVRKEGKPLIVKRQIGNSSISDYEPCFLLYVRSGYNDDNFVSSAIVKIDGKVILNTSNFSNTNNTFQFQLCNLTEASVMELEIRGAPGSVLEVWIEGKLKNQRLLAYYPFNGNTNDESGNNNNGTNFGAALTSDRFGNASSAYYLNGINNYISLPPAVDTVPRTIDLWFNAAVVDTDHLRIIYSFDNPTLLKGLIVVSVQNISGVNKLFMNLSHCIDTIDNILVNKWYNIALVENENKTVKFYLNGNLEGTKTIKRYLTSYNGLNEIILGSDRDATTRYFKGSIDDIRIYNRELKKDEIKSIYNLKNSD